MVTIQGLFVIGIGKILSVFIVIKDSHMRKSGVYKFSSMKQDKNCKYKSPDMKHVK